MLSFVRSDWLDKVWHARREFFLSGVSLLFAIAVAEFGIRAADLYGVSYYESVSDYMRNMKDDPTLIHRHKPAGQERYGNILVSYNERGLRDRPILPKTGDEFRILALGDSVTFGWGVPQDQIFTVKLEQLLQSRLGRKVRVINSGVGGYNTVQELAYFKQEGIAFGPNLVMLTYVENDIEETLQLRTQVSVRDPSPPEIVMTKLQKLWLYRLVQHVYHYGWQHVQERPLSLSQGGQGWSNSMSALDELVSMCGANKIPLIVFYYRLRPDAESPLFQDVVRHAKKFPVKDIGQWFVGQETSSLLISKVDSHPNARAHGLMAEHMAVDITNCLATGSCFGKCQQTPCSSKAL
jgi:lysophospholipase L1-like esterase